MKPFALVFELIPKYYREPPPNDKPCSIIAIPSSLVINSLNLKLNILWLTDKF
jgi:hypothetical protein